MDDDVIKIGGGAPEEVIPVLWDGPDMDLPERATLNADGSVTVTLRYPFDLVYRLPGGGEVSRTEAVETVVLHRLTGADVMKIKQSKRPERAAVIASARTTPAKWELWSKKMDASDETALGRVVTELMAVDRAGLPPRATDHGDAVTLPLLFPRDDEEGTPRAELRFPRMTAAQRRGMQEADDALVWAVCHATGLTPKLARSLLLSMDGADVAGIVQVIDFLG